MKRKMGFSYTKMKNKNLLVTTTTFPRYEKDKEATFVKDLSLELSKNGFNTHVLVPHSYGLSNKDRLDNLIIHRFIYFLPRFEKLAYGGMIPNIKKNKFLLFQIPFFILSELLELIKIVKKYKINVIHSHWLIPQGLCGAISKKIFNLRHITTIHGADLFVLLKIPLSKFLIKFILNNSDHITCVNNEIKEKSISLIGKSYYKKISVIPMGVYTDIYKNKFRFNKKILFLGRLADKKGVKYLLEAVKLLDNKVKILIAGDGPLKDELEDFVRKNNLRDKVKFLGYVTGKEKVDIIKKCGIFIMPSIITEYGDREGMPVSLLEAMAASKAIIVTNVGGISELIKNNYNGILIKQKSSNDIANAINKLTNNKNLAKRLALNARKSVLDYDWKKIGEKYYKILINNKNFYSKI